MIKLKKHIENIFQVYKYEIRHKSKLDIINRDSYE